MQEQNLHSSQAQEQASHLSLHVSQLQEQTSHLSFHVSQVQERMAAHEGLMYGIEGQPGEPDLLCFTDTPGESGGVLAREAYRRELLVAQDIMLFCSLTRGTTKDQLVRC
jgi:hypothetical protein